MRGRFFVMMEEGSGSHARALFSVFSRSIDGE